MAICVAANDGLAGQGAQRLLYTVPNTTFIENPGGDNEVTINDSSGSIAGVQSAINAARGSNPGAIIVITLLRGATYQVSNASLTLGSHECLVASGALIQATDSSVTVPLIAISSGASNVSIAGGTLDGNGAGMQGIYAPSAARVNVDKVVVRNCGLDCILLTGMGNSTYDNEMTVTRCDVSGSTGHAGINIQNSTQTAVLDNDCHGNATGILLSCAWANVANNTCENNTTGIDVSGGNDNVVANNTCNNNGTGIHVGASSGMIVANAISGNTTAGIASTGSANNLLYNSFSANGANGINFSSGGTGDNIIAFKTALSASSQNYFYPPLIDNQHTKTIVNGQGRTDLTISSTSIDNVQSQYDSALSANPNNVIVLRLNGTFTVGASPLTLQSDTCVLLNGTIQINSSTTASAAISGASSATRISISGGTIDGGNLTGNTGIAMTSGESMICLDKITIQNFGDNAASHPGSDSIHFDGGSTPSMVTRCTISKSGSRGIWSGSTSSHKILYADNYVTLTRAGLDCDYHTFGAVSIFNTFVGNTYGLWYEQGAQHNTGIGNVVTNNSRDNLDAGNLNLSQTTEYNNFICNLASPGGYGLVNSAGTNGSTFTSHNFYFNNVILNATIKSDATGTQNYYSQNYQAGGSFTSGSAAAYFNSADVDGDLQILDSNSGLAVTVQNAATNDGAAIVTDVASSLGNGSGNDEWKFIPTSAGFCKVINKNSGLAMVVDGGSTTNGAPIVQFTYSSGTTYNDEWWIQPAGNGLYNFVNRMSGLYLDVTGASTNAGTQLDQWQSNGNANQQFALVEDAPPTAPPDFSISATPSFQNTTPGGGASFTTTITGTNGFQGTVTLSVSGLPSGASGQFSPASISGSGSATLAITTSSSTPAGTYTLAVQGTSGSLSHSTTVSLVLMDFTISTTPSSQTVSVGGGTSYTVNAGNINAFSGTITLSASGLPSGANASFNPASLTAPGSSTMTVSTSGSTPATNATVKITGTSGSLAHSANVTLGVTDFSVSVTPSSRTVGAGSNTTYTATVSPLNGFNGPVTFGPVTGLPSGATASFNPTSVNGSGSSTLTVTTTASTPASTNTLTVPAASGTLVHNGSVSLIVNAAGGGGGLPTGWTNQNIGAVGIAGTAGYNNGTFTVSGSGADIWNAADQFDFAYRSVTNDLTITARVVSESSAVSFAKAAVMIRESTASNAVEVSVLLTPTNGVAMEVRPATGSNSVNVTGWITGLKPPGWVRLVRAGSNFMAFSSTNGVTWTLLGSTNVSMSFTAKAGLAVTSHDNTQLNTVGFDNVSVSPVAFADHDIGAVGVAGSGSYSAGTYTVKGSGTDIWGTNDQFNFYSQSASGDTTITTRVATQQNTSGWAKSGVMIRETLATNAAYVGLYVTISNGVSMQYRGAANTGAIDLARQTGVKAPYWIKLIRSGNSFSGLSSVDGVTWTSVGSTNVTMATNVNIGLAVCAHTNTVLNTTTFDHTSTQ